MNYPQCKLCLNKAVRLGQPRPLSEGPVLQLLLAGELSSWQLYSLVKYFSPRGDVSCGVLTGTLTSGFRDGQMIDICLLGAWFLMKGQSVVMVKLFLSWQPQESGGRGAAGRGGRPASLKMPAWSGARIWLEASQLSSGIFWAP